MPRPRTYVFRTVGSFSARWRFPVVAVWSVLAAGMWLFAPSLAEVGTTEEAAFLPQGTESLQAQEVLQESFPREATPGSAVVVLHDPGGLDEADRTYAREVSAALSGPDAPDEVVRVRSIFTDPALAASLVNEDETSMLIQVALDVPPFEEASRRAIEQIREQLEDAPPDLEVYLTGESAIGADLLASIQRSLDRTTIATVVLVVALVLLIYRSPTAAAVPLAGVAVSFLVARGILGIAADAGWEISSLLDSFLVVLVFGVGTDYALFFMARQREALPGRAAGEAVRNTTERIGPVIAAAATTTVLGLLGLVIARFGLVQTLGPALAIGIAVTLVVSLTLLPALAAVLGERLFWPRSAAESREAVVGAWNRLTLLATARPWLGAVVVLVLLLLPYPQVAAIRTSFDLISQLPDDAGSVEGFQALSESFGPGEALPLTVLVTGAEDLSRPAGLEALDRLGQRIGDVEGVGEVRTVTMPPGDEGEPFLLARNQLETLASQVEAARDGLQQGEAPPDLGQEALDTLDQYLTDLGRGYPEVEDEPTYLYASNAVDRMQAGEVPQQDLVPTLTWTTITLRLLSDQFGSGDFLLSQALLQESPDLRLLVSSFLSADRDTARLSVVLNRNPYSQDAFDTVEAIRDLGLDEGGGGPLTDADLLVGGPTAEFADIEETIQEDFFRVLPAVLLAVGVVIGVLVRSVVAPVYLVLAVLVTVGTTLAASSLILQDLLDQDGLTYFIPLVVLVLLVALGADYNILFMSRLREEDERRGPADAVSETVTRTGPVTRAAGLILAGTFAALLSAPLQQLFQVGVAVSLGILLISFVVVGLLVPAVATGLGRWNWWPGKAARARETEGGTNAEPFRRRM